MLLFRFHIQEHTHTIYLDLPPHCNPFSIHTSFLLDRKYKIFLEYRLYILMCHYLTFQCIDIHDIISINQSKFDIEACRRCTNLLALLEKDAYKLCIHQLRYNLRNNQSIKCMIYIKFLIYFPNYQKYWINNFYFNNASILLN